MINLDKLAIKRFKERGYDEVGFRSQSPLSFSRDGYVKETCETYVLKQGNRGFMVSVEHSKNGAKLKDIILPTLPPPDKATTEQLKKDIGYAFQN
jgi:hypothetical protein